MVLPLGHYGKGWMIDFILSTIEIRRGCLLDINHTSRAAETAR